VSASTAPAFVSAFYTAVSAVVSNVFPAVPAEREDSGLYLFCNQDGPAPLTYVETWHGLGSGAREETYQLPCFLYFRSGDNDAATVLSLLATAYATRETIAALFRPTANFGITGYSLTALISQGIAWPELTPEGLVVQMPFVIEVTAKI
jgi:hypothetical protein